MKDRRKKMGRFELGAVQPEILLQVLQKLPLKFATRCKLVCKEWNSVISDPYFLRSYKPDCVQNHPLTLMIIPYWPTTENPPLKYMYERKGSMDEGVPHCFLANFNGRCLVKVLGSWNGLLALYYKKGLHVEFCLFNPTTKEHKVVGVAINDEVYNFSDLGLCYDCARDEYKVVLRESTRFYVVSFKDERRNYCKSNIRHSDVLRDLYMYRHMSDGTIVKGAPHWVFGSLCDPKGPGEVIVNFDPLTEEFGRIQLPGGRCPWKKVYGLGALDGKLTVTIFTPLGGFEVWALKEYGNENSWRRLFEIEPIVWLEEFTADLSVVSVLGRMTGEEVLISVNDEVRMLYNVRKRRWRRLPLGKMKMKMNNPYYQLVTYFPTLVSPN